MVTCKISIRTVESTLREGQESDAELFENEKSVALKQSQSSHKTGQVPGGGRRVLDGKVSGLWIALTENCNM